MKMKLQLTTLWVFLFWQGTLKVSRALSRRIIPYEDPSCVLYLGFDRYFSEFVYDDSQQNNQAVLANGALVTKVSGSCGMCLQLLTGQVVVNGKNFSGIPNDSITISFMINMISVDGNHQIFQTSGDHSNHKDDQYLIEVLNGKIRWFHRNEQGYTVFAIITDQAMLRPSHWTEIAVTYNSSDGRAAIYVNGSLSKQEISKPMSLSTDWGQFIGIGGNIANKITRAYIDQFSIFNRSLSPKEIRSLYWWCKERNFDEQLHLDFAQLSEDQRKVYDLSSSRNDATLTNGTSVANPGVCKGGASIPSGWDMIRLDGSRFHNRPTSAVTVALWVRLADQTPHHCLFCTYGKRSLHTHAQYMLGVEGGSVIWSHRNEFDQEIFFVRTQTLIYKGTWNHVAATFDATKQMATIYLNGEVRVSGVGKGALSEDWDQLACFGKHATGSGSSSNNSFDQLDDIYIFSRELSAPEVRTLFTRCSDILKYGIRSEIYKAPIQLQKRGLRRLVTKEDTSLDRRHVGKTKREVRPDLITDPEQMQFLYYTFERVMGNKTFDDSGFGNNADLTQPGKYEVTAGRCGHGLLLQGANLYLQADQLQSNPLRGISVLLWLFLVSNDGNQEIFQTIDPNLTRNRHGQFYLELISGFVRWMHRNNDGETVFSIESTKSIKAQTWTHLAAIFDPEKGCAEILLDGEVVAHDLSSESIMQRELKGRISFGKMYNLNDSGAWVEARPLSAFIDEIYLYGRALNAIEASALGQTCDYRRIVLYFSFTRLLNDSLVDQSGLGNHGQLVEPWSLVNGSCGTGINLTSHGYILLSGDHFRQKPMMAMSISVWIRLNTNRGHHEIFSTQGIRSIHKHVQTHLAVVDAKIQWSHMDHLGQVVFNLTTQAVVLPRTWVNIIVSFDSESRKATAFLDGRVVDYVPAVGILSQDWGDFAGIGQHPYRQHFFDGIIDEFTMFNYALPEYEIKYMSQGNC